MLLPPSSPRGDGGMEGLFNTYQSNCTVGIQVHLCSHHHLWGTNLCFHFESMQSRKMMLSTTYAANMSLRFLIYS